MRETVCDSWIASISHSKQTAQRAQTLFVPPSPEGEIRMYRSSYFLLVPLTVGLLYVSLGMLARQGQRWRRGRFQREQQLVHQRRLKQQQ
jgi:hypothetical protein